MTPPLTTDALSAAIRRGARWVVVGQVTSQAISLGTLALLYRLVLPEEFGLFGMAVPFVLLPRTLATLGLSAATVQRHELTRDDRAQLFWMQTGLGLAITVGTVFFAWLAAWLYGVPKVAPLVQAMSATVLLASLAATHQALLERRLQLPRVTIIRLVGQTLGASLAITAAWYGWGAQALVVQQYGELGALLLASWIAEPWLPHVPRWRSSAWRELATFGGLSSLSSLLFVLAQNVDKLLLGYWLGGTPAGQAVVGAYTQAYNLMMRPVYLVTTPLSSVLLPALSRAVLDRETFEKLTHHAFRLAGNVLLPMSVGLWFVAVDAVTVLGGPAWRDAGMLLSAFAPVIAIQGWINLCGSVVTARGKAGLLSFGALVTLLLSVQGVIVGHFVGEQLWPAPLGPALGVALALTLTTMAVLGPPYIGVMLAACGVRLRNVGVPMLPAVRASIAMGLIVAAGQWLLRDVEAAVRLPLVIALGSISYSLLMLPEVRWLLQLARRDQGEVTRVQDGGSLAGKDSSEAS